MDPTESTPYFITGFPRSRTGWLSVFMATPEVPCFHDLLGTTTWAGLVERAMRMPCGFSDSGLLFHVQAAIDRFPGAPWVFVHRNFEDAWRSFCELPENPVGDLTQRQSEEVRVRMQSIGDWARMRLKKKAKCLVVEYEKVDAQLGEIWEHLKPGKRFSMEHARELCRMNVTVKPERMMEGGR